MDEPRRNVMSSTAGPNGFACLLSCGHTVLCPAVPVRGSRFSQRAPLTATCTHCPKGPSNV